MINLRPFQRDAISAIKNTFLSTDRQFVEMPTGSGKTITFLSYAKTTFKKVLVIVPTKELLKQVYESALNFYDRRNISRKGSGFDERVGDLHIAIIASVRGKYLDILAQKKFDLVVIDEAHHVQAPSYRAFIDRICQEPSGTSIKFLGLTATPNRSDGLFLQEVLGKLSYKLDIQSLINSQHLSDIEGFCIKTKCDLSDIDSHNGDFSIRQLYKRLCVHERNQMIVNICKQEMSLRKTLIFCINIQHSKEICRLLQKENIFSAHIDGSMDDEQRLRILTDFRHGKINFLCNCQLLTEGFDEPSIDGLILARPTRSRALFTQMIGRGLRTFKGKKNCKIIDVVDNHRALAGFNELLGDEFLAPIERFKSVNEIQKHREKEILKINEYKVTRSNLLNINNIENLIPTSSMLKYIEENKIFCPFPLSFDECSFLMWLNELKKECQLGNI